MLAVLHCVIANVQDPVGILQVVTRSYLSLRIDLGETFVFLYWVWIPSWPPSVLTPLRCSPPSVLTPLDSYRSLTYCKIKRKMGDPGSGQPLLTVGVAFGVVGTAGCFLITIIFGLLLCLLWRRTRREIRLLSALPHPSVNLIDLLRLLFDCPENQVERGSANMSADPKWVGLFSYRVIIVARIIVYQGLLILSASNWALNGVCCHEHESCNYSIEVWVGVSDVYDLACVCV